MAVPDDLGQTKVGDLDQTNATCTVTLDEFTLVCLVLLIGGLWMWVLCWDEWDWVEKKILWLYVSGNVSACNKDIFQDPYL